MKNHESNLKIDSRLRRNDMGAEFQGHESTITDPERRSMLKVMGASIALAGVGVGCRRPVDKILPYTRKPKEVTPGIPNHFATVMPHSDGAIGMVVESHEGRPTKIEGNELHPASLGAMTAQGQASVLSLYDPDRSREVLRKTGDKFQKSAWSAWDLFCKDHLETYQASKGEGLAFLTEDLASPTEARLARRIQRSLPKAKWYRTSLRPSTLEDAMVRYVGSGLRPHYHFENAKVILSLQADFLNSGPEQLLNSKGFSKGRKVYQKSDVSKMNRLYAAESDYSTTGAAADHRIPVSQTETLDFLRILATEMMAYQDLNWRTVFPTLEAQADFKGAISTNAAFERKRFVAMMRDFVANKGQALIVVGEHQPAEAHVLAYVLNVALGGYGKTFTLSLSKSDYEPAISFGDLPDFVKAANRNQIRSAFVLGGNIVYASPTTLGVAAALSKVKDKVHFGSYLDETAQLCDWHLPASHFLEDWGDARAYDGTAAVVQPLIAPLFGTRTRTDIYSNVLGSDLTSYDQVRTTWKATKLGTESAWRKAIHDGVIGGTEFKRLKAPPHVQLKPLAAKVGRSKSSQPDGLELILKPCAKIEDGRLANNAWMQEMPDPMTKLVWGNALLVGPAFAKANGIQSRVDKRIYMADMVSLTAGGQSLEVPVFILPGMAATSSALALGYGRHAAGTIGTGVGVNAYALMPVDGSTLLTGCKVKRLDKMVELTTTQEQFAMNGDAVYEVAALSLNGRDPGREATVKKFVTDPTYAKNHQLPATMMAPVKKGSDEVQPVQMTKSWDYKGNKWGMVIDLTSCSGCNACVVACQSENNIPVVGAEQVKRGRLMHWLRIDRYYEGDVNNPRSLTQPVPCMHCENAPCEPVCPVAATTHDKEGLNTMAYNRCIGTRYCANNCPVKVRHFNYFDYTNSGNLYVAPIHKARQQVSEMQKNPDVTVRYRGTMEKCTYCTQRIQEAKATARRAGKDPNKLRDGDVTPACAQTCPSESIVFGNLNDPDSEVSKLKEGLRNFDLLNELNIRPRTSYLAKLRNPNPELV